MARLSPKDIRKVTESGPEGKFCSQTRLCFLTSEATALLGASGLAAD